MKGEQKYATKVFDSLKSAEGFKKKLGDISQVIRQDKLGRYKVKWKIDKSRPKDYRNNNSDNIPDFEEHWKF